MAISAGVAAIMGGAQIGSAILGAKATKGAAASAAAGQRNALALQKEIYEKNSALAQPFVSGGTDAYAQLLASYGIGGNAPDYSSFYNAPDYQFALQQGQQALDRSAAAGGRLYSGAQQKATQQFGQGLATQYLGNYRSGLGNAAGMGINALGTLTGVGENYANQGGQIYSNIGDINAAGRLGTANIYGNAMQTVAGIANAFGGGRSSYNPYSSTRQYGDGKVMNNPFGGR